MTLSRALAALVFVAALGRPSPAQDFPLVRGEHPVLITVDDLPLASNRLHPDPAERERITRGLLDVLKKHAIPAVGLVTWRNVEGPAGERLLDLWLQAGHELGNHSHAHLDYTRTDAEAYIADVEKGRAALAAFLSARRRTLRFFRFPFLREGDTKDKLARAREWLRATGQRNLPVTIDDQDWSFEQPWVEAVRAGDTARQTRLAEDFQHALRLETLFYTAAGDALFERPTPQILLLHANAVGAAQWDALFTWMKGRGFRFATADEVLADRAFFEPPDFVGRYGGSLWDRIRHINRQGRAQREVNQLLERQAADWSRGDLAAFCAAYSEDAVFMAPPVVTGGDAALMKMPVVTRGREHACERYRRRYTDALAMGRLELKHLELRPLWGPEVTPLGDATPGAVHVVTAVARWRLQREGHEEASRHALLVLRRGPDGWRIAQDASMDGGALPGP